MTAFTYVVVTKFYLAFPEKKDSMKKMWCFSVTHVIAWAHYDVVFRKMIYPFSGSYLYFLIWIAVGMGMIVAETGKV